MKTGSKGKALIKEFEGYYTALPDGGCIAYLDKVASPPVWTIGYGCTEGVYKGLVWTKAQAEAALDREIAQTEQEVAQVLKVPLDQNRYDALISIGYNLKGGIRKAPTLMKHINNQNWTEASKAFMLYCKAGSKTIKGLERRRAAERKLFDTWTEQEIAETSTTVSTLRKWRNGLSVSALLAMVMDAVGVGREYVDWLAQYSPPTKYVIAAGVVGAGFGLVKYVQHKKLKEHEAGRYTPAEEGV